MDVNFKSSYFLEVARVVKQSEQPLAASIADKIVEMTTTKNLGSLKWMNKILYNRHGRGAYEAATGNAYLSLTPIAENIVPIVHEVLHAIDPVLNSARNDLGRIYKENLNYYIFLKNIYLPYYKEVIPRIVSCEFYMDLRYKNLLSSLSHEEERDFKLVIQNQENCTDWTQQSFHSSLAPNYFWPSESSNFKEVKNYEINWLKDNNLNIPFLIFK